MAPISAATFTSSVVIGCSVALLLVSGCSTNRPQAKAEETISASLGLPDAVVFRTEGDPLDASTETDDVLPLPVAIRRAVETSPELQAALSRVRVAQAEADLAEAFPNPILSLVFRIPEGGGTPDIEAGIAADLIALLQRPRRASAASHRLEAETASALSSALDVVFEVQSLYVDVQTLEELFPLLDGRLATLGRLRDVAQARLDLGEGTRQDVTSLEAERMALAVEASRTRQALRLSRITLARRIGEPSGAAMWRLDPWQGPLPLPTEERAWIRKAISVRPEVLAVEWEIRARGDDAAIAGLGSLDGGTVGVEAERDGDWSLGPSASAPLPIFDTGTARKRRARALESEAKHRLTEVQRAVVEEVRTSLASLIGSQENLQRVVGDLIPLQERRRAEVEAAYRLGHVDLTALLLAEQALRETEAGRVDLEREVSNALLRLQRAVGGPSAFDETVSDKGGRSEP